MPRWYWNGEIRSKMVFVNSQQKMKFHAIKYVNWKSHFFMRKLEDRCARICCSSCNGYFLSHSLWKLSSGWWIVHSLQYSDILKLINIIFLLSLFLSMYMSFWMKIHDFFCSYRHLNRMRSNRNQIMYTPTFFSNFVEVHLSLISSPESS